jgi:hypothetical protein
LRLARALFLVLCASPALAQHEGHMMNAAGTSPPRFDFSAALIFADAAGFRGGRKFSARDWEMFQSSSYLGNRLSFRAMTSLTSLIPDSAGIPSLVQGGGAYQRGWIFDRQHPEDLVMEASSELRFGKAFVSLSPIGAPALGPSPYLHRPSGIADPIAPIGHHWQDATHVSYGVATLGARARGATLEASAFNARESDFEHPWPDFSHGRLDSFAGRVGFLRSGIGLQGWWGYLKGHDPTTPEMQMHRYGASLSLDKGRSSSLAVWGMNVHHHDGASHLFLHGDPNASPHARSSSGLLESSLKVNDALVVFGRAERVRKSGEELGFQGGNLLQLYDIRSASLGLRRDVATAGVARLALAARGSAIFLPPTLELTYGRRTPLELHLFAQARRAP